MATAFELPEPWRKSWRLKIRDRETVEPPNVTLLRGTKSWRINLRTGQFLDRTPAPREVPRQLLRHVLGRFDEFISVWDELYPLNPVQSLERDSDDED